MIWAGVRSLRERAGRRAEGRRRTCSQEEGRQGGPLRVMRQWEKLLTKEVLLCGVRGTKSRWVACTPLRKQFQIRRDAGQRMWGRGRQWGGQGDCGVQTLGGKGQGREQKLEERAGGGKGVWVSF